MRGRLTDLRNSRFGKLTVVGLERGSARGARWACRCDCGTEIVTSASSLVRGSSQSCGCARNEKIAETLKRHGHWSGGKASPEYGAWDAARRRCTNPSDRSYARYGGRGIDMCNRWVSGEGDTPPFECFIADMGLRPSPAHSLDRTNNSQGYSPENCRWATCKQQGRNRRTTIMLFWRGRQITAPEIVEITGLKYVTVKARLRMGWPIDRIMSEPAHPYVKRAA
jgi:hypothetical protein